MRRHRNKALWYVLAVALSLSYVLPMGYAILTALTPTGDSIGSMPHRLAFGNFPAGLGSDSFGIFAVNSVTVALVATACQIVVSALAGYAMAKLPLPGGNWFLLLLVALIVVPPEIVIVPLFLMMAHFPLAGGNNVLGMGGQGLIDTLGGLMVPHLVSALAIFLMRQFYRGLPDELGDAARVDGASELAIMARIYTPLVAPAIAIVGIFAFQNAWNDFLWPLIMTRSPERRTLQLGLTTFFQENSTSWNLLMAVVITISVPVVALFLYLQRFFRPDVMSGALK